MSRSSTADRKVRKNWGDAELVPGPMNGPVGMGLAEVLLRVVQAQPNVETICDLGSGTGFLSSRLGELGYRVTGIDASDRLLAVATEQFATAQVTFHHGVIGEDSLDALAPPGGFDLVISSDVVEHLFHPKSLVESAFRILRPGGCLILGTPYHGYLKNLAISVLGRWDEHHGVHWDGGHIKFFSVRTLQDLVQSAGYTIERFEYYGRLPGLWKNMICVARKPVA
jgi:2-polyprenyl-3-methyl-5-hydroxy-6-metoxy-1,4-benzoquinol methylase